VSIFCSRGTPPRVYHRPSTPNPGGFILAYVVYSVKHNSRSVILSHLLVLRPSTVSQPTNPQSMRHPNPKPPKPGFGAIWAAEKPETPPHSAALKPVAFRGGVTNIFFLRFRVLDFGFGVGGLGFGVWGFGFRTSGFGFRVSGFEFWVMGLGFEDWGWGAGFLVVWRGRPAAPWRDLLQGYLAHKKTHPLRTLP
jgi:hypothetical protein